ncbi:MAG: GNAT family N-acetyltransferase [Lysobacterales bacterium]
MALIPGNDPKTRTAYRVETERLMLRCWSPADAPALRAALDACDTHLRPWIPFMKDEPRTLQQTARWLRGHRAAFDTGTMYRYAVFDSAEKTLLGENMLMARVGPGGLEIGYWTHKAAIGRGIANEATCAMIRVAFDIEKAARVEIICAPENRASALIPARLGFTHEATLKKRVVDTEGVSRDLMVWSLFADDYPSSPAAELVYRAFDCMDEVIN